MIDLVLAKHGDWSEYSVCRMIWHIACELLEVFRAAIHRDFYGEHGVYNELSQVAATAVKGMMVLKRRWDVGGKVVSLEQARLEREHHLSGTAICLHCGHEHMAVVPVGVVEMECPACHTMKWTCACGCHLFMISGESREIICWKCGEYQRGFGNG